MNKEQKLHIADTLKVERRMLNELYADVRTRMNKLDDLEMYVRMLPVEETVDEEHDKAIPAGCYF